MLSGRWDTHTRLLRHHAKVEAFCFGRPARMSRSLNLIDFHFGSSACDALLFVFGPGIPNVRWECACVGPNSRLGPLATGIRGGRGRTLRPTAADASPPKKKNKKTSKRAPDLRPPIEPFWTATPGRQSLCTTRVQTHTHVRTGREIQRSGVRFGLQAKSIRIYRFVDLMRRRRRSSLS